MDVEILVPLGFFLSIVWIVKIISDNRIRRKLVDQRVSDEMARAIMQKGATPSAFGALKWGLVILGIGGALIIGHILTIDMDDPIGLGFVFLAAGAGLVTYYFMTTEEEDTAPKAKSSEDIDFEDLP